MSLDISTSSRSRRCRRPDDNIDIVDDDGTEYKGISNIFPSSSTEHSNTNRMGIPPTTIPPSIDPHPASSSMPGYPHTSSNLTPRSQTRGNCALALWLGDASM
jgi:hypothetical protein